MVDGFFVEVSDDGKDTVLFIFRVDDYRIGYYGFFDFLFLLME